MKSLIIDATPSTPAIDFHADGREMAIKGHSCPENAAGFYAPILAWLDDYLALQQLQPITMNLEIVHFNNSSFSALLDLLTRLDASARGGRRVRINWRCHVHNDMALEYGEELQKELQTVDFHWVEVAD